MSRKVTGSLKSSGCILREPCISKIKKRMADSGHWWVKGNHAAPQWLLHIVAQVREIFFFSHYKSMTGWIERCLCCRLSFHSCVVSAQGRNETELEEYTEMSPVITQVKWFTARHYTATTSETTQPLVYRTILATVSLATLMFTCRQLVRYFKIIWGQHKHIERSILSVDAV